MFGTIYTEIGFLKQVRQFTLVARQKYSMAKQLLKFYNK